jgi:hypothetical protein
MRAICLARFSTAALAPPTEHFFDGLTAFAIVDAKTET